VTVFGKWQEVWASKPTWREALQLQKRGAYSGSIWYKVPTQLSRCTPRLIRLLERLANPTDVPAKIALDHVSRIWRRPAEERFNQVDRPVLLENRIEVLQQAAALLALSQKT
jgi:hypothetical protein